MTIVGVVYLTIGRSDQPLPKAHRSRNAGPAPTHEAALADERS